MASANVPQVSTTPPLRVEPVGEDASSARTMREAITIWLIGLLCAVVALAFIGLLLGEDVSSFANLEAVVDSIVTPLIPLLSTVIGFYFGSQAAKDK